MFIRLATDWTIFENILTKLAQIFSNFLGYLEKALFNKKNLFGYFFGQLWGKSDHFFISTSDHTVITI